jgi:hypothetical protein
MTQSCNICKDRNTCEHWKPENTQWVCELYQPTTLKEFIKDYQGQYVKIGSAVSYIFCGLVDELFEDEILRQEKYIHKYLDNHAKLFKQLYDTFDERYDEIERQKLTSWRKTKHKAQTEKEYKEILARTRAANFERIKKQLASYTGKLERFTPLLSRQVVDCYKSTEEKQDCTIIHITGEEQGRFWTIWEYEQYMLDRKGWSPTKRYGNHKGVL